MFDEFSTETGLSADAVIVLMSLMMISFADVLRDGSAPWISRTSLGTLSQLTAIPKETVRRKLKKLSDAELIFTKSDSTYQINTEKVAVKNLILRLDNIEITKIET